MTQAGPELEIPTLNLQEAGFRGVFLWVLCGSLLWLSLFCRDGSSGWPQTSCVRDCCSAPDPGPPPLRGWEDRHGSLGWTWGPLSGALFPGLEKGNKTVHAAAVSVGGQALYTAPDVPNGIQTPKPPAEMAIRISSHLQSSGWRRPRRKKYLAALVAEKGPAC